MFSLGHYYSKTCGQAGEGPGKSHKEETKPGKLPCDERLRELDSSSLEKRGLRGNLITLFQFLRSEYKEDGGSLFTSSNMEKMRENSNSTQKEFSSQ